MRMIGRKNEQQIYQETRKAVIDSTPLVDLEQTSVLGGLVSAFAKKVAEIHDVLSTNYLARFARTAFGSNLDSLLEDRQLQRFTQFATNVTCDSKILALRTRDGSTIKSKLSNQAPDFYVIPAGVTIRSSLSQNITFVTNETTYITNTDRVVYLGVSGEIDNLQVVAAGSLDTFDFGAVSAFAGADIAGLQLVQSANIIGIQQVETDDQARQRYYNWTTTAARANSTALTSDLRSHPEVAYVSIQRFVRGTGSAEIIAVPVGKRLSKSTLRELQGIVNNNSSYGEATIVVQPDYIPVNMVIQVFIAADSSRTVGIIENFIANLGLGASLSYASISRALQNENINAKVVSLNIDRQTILPTRTVSILPNELFDLDISTEEDTSTVLTPVRIIIG